ncbi:longevity assurance homolog 5 (S. cerevisiae) (predicted), isoform CRA_a [Rattus norvegicus]|uniref:Longevity assurance homolog 5 (S. cerevisiae) (Predicted), isoform CRA_a n=2 Tax=Rattus norvegicus TaxID=10116 RepID=A6KCH5_RAT|nr:ceramide synthase 5 [Rattus norvegicus]EDL86967.1 longevity assurance homolog 5 (S. cerevisiae) (predicted), isoform CRA_a [Rattus norvegicus]|eukprot:NP_001102463.1 ceramide synthase 5 [Rattus norvegicus]
MATAAAEALGLLWGWLWSGRFWLPQNVSWADLEGPGDGYGYPRARHVLSVFPLAAGLFSVRMLFERFIAKPCALRIGIEDSAVYQVESNVTLEKVFTSISKYPDEKRLKGLSKQLDWDVRKIQCWFRHRRNQDKPPTLTKFCESMWRFTFYFCIFCYGVRFLWSMPWLWDTRQCWYNYPYQPLSRELYYYYLTQLAFYWSLVFSQFIDVKRKDFLMMFMHHLIAVTLISFSYINNMVRVGAIILCLHDSADSLLEAAKLANYARQERLCNTLFVIFGAAFMVTRLGIFPLWILNTTLFESWEIIGPFPSWWLFNGLLLILQMLHVIWSYLIARTAFKALVRGKVTYPGGISPGSVPSALFSPPSSFLCLVAAGQSHPLHVSKDDRSDVESSSEEDETTHTNNLSGSSSSNGANCMNGRMGGSHLAEEQGTCKAAGNLHFGASPRIHSCD